MSSGVLQVLSIIYLCALCFSFVIGLIKFRRLDQATRILILLLGLTIGSEGLAFSFAKRHVNNMPIYHFYSPIELFISSLYFNYSVPALRKNNIGWYIGLIGIVAGFLNAKYLQPLTSFNSYFLLFEGFCILSLSLFAFYTILENEEFLIFKTPHFWICCIMMFFWGVTYASWSLYNTLGTRKIEVIPYFGLLLLAFNVINYLAFGIVFIFYPKKQIHE